MPDLTPIFDELLPFALVLARISGLFLFTPVLTSPAAPAAFKALLLGSFAFAVYAFIPPAAQLHAERTAIEFGWFLFTELLVGVAIGQIATLPLLALEMGGALMGYQMGLSLAQSYNPEMESSSDAAGQLLFYVGVTTLLATGGLERCFLLVCESFSAIPVGAPPAADSFLPLLVAVLHSGTELALRVAAPVVGVISLLMVAEAFIMRSAPQMNIMTIAFAAKAIFGLAMLAVCLIPIHRAVADEIALAFRSLDEWLFSLAGPASGTGVLAP